MRSTENGEYTWMEREKDGVEENRTGEMIGRDEEVDIKHKKKRQEKQNEQMQTDMILNIQMLFYFKHKW